ncbi:hypothetical protein BG004_004295 [Podila humilis]|nr:hypothetical protein BG004_004295 [Podila humilis]
MTSETPMSTSIDTSHESKQQAPPRPPLTTQKKPRPLPDTLAYVRFTGHAISGVIKYTALFLMGKTPKTQTYGMGVGVAGLSSGVDGLTLMQARAFATRIKNKNAKNSGLGTPEAVARWAIKVETKEWSGFWIPFQDQIHTVKFSQNSSDDNNSNISNGDVAPASIDVGSGCDVVLIWTHGGGFIDGHALQLLHFFKDLMKSVQQEQNLKVGILAIAYSLAPETPFPGAVNECVAAYRDLITVYGIPCSKIFAGGESAGGNLAHVLTLKIRDEHPELGQPLGTITISPYFFAPGPMEHTLFDFITPLRCVGFEEHYTQNNPKVLSSQYCSPMNATTLAGLPPMLIMVGGVEQFRPSIEQFAERVKHEGGQVDLLMENGRAHCWCVAEPMSTEADRTRVKSAIGKFLTNNRGPQ